MNGFLTPAEAMQPANYNRYWPLLIQAYERDDSRSLELGYIWHAIEAGALRVWLSNLNMLTFSVVGTQGYIVHGTGQLPALVKILPQIEEICRQAGAVSMQLWGRRGWDKVLTDYNRVHREANQILLEKRL